MVGDVPCLALRVTYVGELGWELYCPTEYGLALWDTLVAAGEPHGLVPAGYRAIDTCGSRRATGRGARTSRPETTPEAAGLGFAVRIDKPAPFIGRDALLAERAAGGPAERLRCLVLDDPRAVCLGGEPVRLAGATAGRVTSGGYGYRSSEASPTPTFPPTDPATAHRAEVDVFGTRVGARVVSEPIWNPDNSRIRQSSRPGDAGTCQIADAAGTTRS